AATEVDPRRVHVPEHGHGHDAEPEPGVAGVDRARGRAGGEEAHPPPRAEGRQQALEHVEGETEEPRAAPQDAPDVGRADVARAVLADVHAARTRDEQAEGDRPGEEGEQQQEEPGHVSPAGAAAPMGYARAAWCSTAISAVQTSSSESVASMRRKRCGSSATWRRYPSRTLRWNSLPLD